MFLTCQENVYLSSCEWKPAAAAACCGFSFFPSPSFLRFFAGEFFLQGLYQRIVVFRSNYSDGVIKGMDFSLWESFSNKAVGVRLKYWISKLPVPSVESTVFERYLNWNENSHSLRDSSYAFNALDFPTVKSLSIPRVSCLSLLYPSLEAKTSHPFHLDCIIMTFVYVSNEITATLRSVCLSGVPSPSAVCLQL